MKNKVTKDTLIGDVIKKYPSCVEVLLKHDMHCIGCHVATWETIGQAAESHGIDVDGLVKEMNKILK